MVLFYYGNSPCPSLCIRVHCPYLDFAPLTVLFGNTFTKPFLLTAFMGFIGILIITRPNLETLNGGTTAAALAALSFAESIMISKGLTHNHNTLSILFIMMTMQLVFGIITSGWDFEIAPFTAENFFWVFAIGITGLLAHLSLTEALSLAPAPVVSPVDFLRLPVIAIVGYLLFDEAIDQFLIFGVILIYAGIYITIFGERLAEGKAF